MPEDLENLSESDILAYHGGSLIDQVVYKLYGLTEEETRIIEQSVKG